MNETKKLVEEITWKRLEESRVLLDSALIDFAKAILEEDLDAIQDACSIFMSEAHFVGQTCMRLSQFNKSEENDEEDFDD